MKAGTWGGAPESKKVEKLLAQLKKPQDSSFFSSNTLWDLTDEDPKGALTVLRAAEEKSRVESLRWDPDIAKFRLYALMTLRDVDAVLATFHAYLAAARLARGFYNPPLRQVARFFDEMNKKAWAEEPREIEALDATYYLARV